jgi:hypothetical protein
MLQQLDFLFIPAAAIPHTITKPILAGFQATTTQLAVVRTPGTPALVVPPPVDQFSDAENDTDALRVIQDNMTRPIVTTSQINSIGLHPIGQFNTDEEEPAIAADPTSLNPPSTLPMDRLTLQSPHPVHPPSPPPPIGKPNFSKFRFKFDSKYN